MAFIRFVNNYEDLSTDRGFQFRFNCDKCGNGHMSRFQPSVIGTAGSLLRAAGSLFGGWAGSAGHSAYELQRAVGGKAHDDALAVAVEEGKQHFKQCSRCGKWVCPDVCWNHSAGQCEECSPDFQEEMQAAHAQAKANAAREQLEDKARATDLVGHIDMKASGIRSNGKAGTTFCTGCGVPVSGKFCGECGAPAQVRPALTCQQCGHRPDTPGRFCPECGGRFN
jgi:hypothetical protein